MSSTATITHTDLNSFNLSHVQWINDFNIRAEEELRREAQEFGFAATLESEKIPGSPNAFALAGAAPSFVAQQSPSPHPETLSSNDGSSYLSFTPGHKTLRVLLFAVGATLCSGVPALIAARPDERKEIFDQMVTNAVKAAAIIGTSAVVADFLKDALLRNSDKILKLCAAGTIASSLTRNVVPVAPIAMALAATSVKSLWHLLLSATSFDAATRAYHKSQAGQCWNLDDAVHMAASSVSTAILSTFMAPLGLGLLGQTVAFSLLLVITAAITEGVIKSKNDAGGWLAWFRVKLVRDTREYTWTSAELDVYEPQITDRLRCPITHSLVVDPVVGGVCGRVYERAPLYRHLRERGTDPCSNTDATARYYKSSKVALRLSKEIAAHFGAKLELNGFEMK